MQGSFRAALISQRFINTLMTRSFWLWPCAVAVIKLPHMKNMTLDDQETPKETGSLLMKRRRLLFDTTSVVLLALAVVAGVWTALWLAMADAIETGISDWIADQQHQGVKYNYKSLEVSGFPLWFKVRIKGASALVERMQSLEWRAPTLAARIRPWRPAEIDVDLSGLHQFVGFKRIDLTSHELGAKVHLLGSGAWRGKLKGKDVSTEFPRVGALSAKRLAIDFQWRGKRVEAGQSPLRLDLTGENIQLPAAWLLPLGSVVAVLRLTAYVTKPLKPLRDPEALVQWRDAGGTLELNRLSLEYGPLHLDGDGTFALDDDLQPMGAFVARAEGFMETLDAFQSRDTIDIGQATALKLMLMILAHQPAGRPPYLEVPLTLQDREVILKSLVIKKLPRINWSHVLTQRVP